MKWRLIKLPKQQEHEFDSAHRCIHCGLKATSLNIGAFFCDSFDIKWHTRRKNGLCPRCGTAAPQANGFCKICRDEDFDAPVPINVLIRRAEREMEERARKTLMGEPTERIYDGCPYCGCKCQEKDAS